MLAVSLHELIGRLDGHVLEFYNRLQIRREHGEFGGLEAAVAQSRGAAIGGDRGCVAGQLASQGFTEEADRGALIALICSMSEFGIEARQTIRFHRSSLLLVAGRLVDSRRIYLFVNDSSFNATLP